MFGIKLFTTYVISKFFNRKKKKDCEIKIICRKKKFFEIFNKDIKILVVSSIGNCKNNFSSFFQILYVPNGKKYKCCQVGRSYDKRNLLETHIIMHIWRKYIFLRKPSSVPQLLQKNVKYKNKISLFKTKGYMYIIKFSNNIKTFNYT